MQKFKYIFITLPLLAITLFSCNAQKKATTQAQTPIIEAATGEVDTFAAEKNKVGDAFPDITIKTWDNKIVTTDGLIKGEPILFVLFNPGCGHCKDIVTNVKNNLGMFKEANIIFLAGKPLQGKLPRFVAEMKLDKTEEIVLATAETDVVNWFFEYNGIPQIMMYDKNHKLVHIYYSEASILDIQNKMYGR